MSENTLKFGLHCIPTGWLEQLFFLLRSIGVSELLKVVTRRTCIKNLFSIIKLFVILLWAIFSLRVQPSLSYPENSGRIWTKANNNCKLKLICSWLNPKAKFLRNSDFQALPLSASILYFSFYKLKLGWLLVVQSFSQQDSVACSSLKTAQGLLQTFFGAEAETMQNNFFKIGGSPG